MKYQLRISIALALAVLAFGCARSQQPRAVGTFPNAPVIVISIDTLRADHLPAWGYKGVATPSINALIRDGVLFENAYAHVPLTLPSHATLLSGRLPGENGVRDNIGYTFVSNGATLPEVLQKRGYATAGAVSAFVLRAGTGIGSVFQSYDDAIAFEPGTPAGRIARPGTETVAVARKWVDAHASSPFFFFLHLFEPHAPYDAPEPFRSASATPYDGEVAYADSIVGTFIADLKAKGIYDRAIIVLLSDHGEGLGEHGEKEHGIFLYRESLHVPLIIKLPRNGAAGTRITAPAGLIDILPTITALTGVPTPSGLSGRALLANVTPDANRLIFGESMYARLHFGWSELRSMIDSRFHYIDAPRPEIYSFVDDPNETRNVAGDQRRVLASFRDAMLPHRAPLTAPGAASAEEAQTLRSLGYLSSPAGSSSGPLPDPKDRIADLAAFEDASTAVAAGDFASAVPRLETLVHRNPNFTDAAFELAHAYEQTGRYADAARVYRDALQKNPALVEQAAIGLATAYMNMGQLKDAREHAELALRANPGGASLLLARIALAAGNPAQAERDAQVAMRDVHYRAVAVSVAAEAMMQSGPTGALRALDLLKNAERDAVARGEAPPRGTNLRRADALVRLGRIDEAIAALRMEIGLRPGDPEACTNLAALYFLRRDDAEATAVLDQMMRVNPSEIVYRRAIRTVEHFRGAGAAEAWRGTHAGMPAR